MAEHGYTSTDELHKIDPITVSEENIERDAPRAIRTMEKLGITDEDMYEALGLNAFIDRRRY